MNLRLTGLLGLGLLIMSPLMSPAELRPGRHLAHFAKARLQLPGLLEECRALTARKIPYVYGGTSDEGMDCSASVQRLFRNRGISLPRTSEGQANTLARRGQLWRVAAGESELDVFKRLKPGELLFWVKNESPNRVSHVMVFVGMDGKKAKLWGARGTGKTGLSGSGVDFCRYSPGSRKRSRIVAHGAPRP